MQDSERGIETEGEVIDNPQDDGITLESGQPVGNTDTESIKPDRRESAIDTVKRAAESLKAKAEEAAPEDESETEAPKEKVGPTTTFDKNGKKVVTFEAKVKAPKQKEAPFKAPNSLDLEAKEALIKAPPAVQKSVTKLLEKRDALFTQRTTELAEKEKDVEEVLQAVRPSLGRWGLKGYTAGRAVKELIAAQDYLMSQPDEAIAYLIKERKANVKNIMRMLGIEQPAGQQTGKQDAPAAQQIDIASHPEIKRLTDLVTELQNERVQEKTTAQQREVSSIQQEIETVREEVDGKGNYRYPMMHDPNFLNRMKPLVSALYETLPEGTSWADITKRAYSTLTGNFLEQSQTRLPAQDKQQLIAKAKAGNVSIRGRGAQAGGF